MQDLTGSPIARALVNTAYYGARIYMAEPGRERALFPVLQSLYDSVSHHVESSDIVGDRFNELLATIAGDIDRLGSDISTLKQSSAITIHHIRYLCGSGSCGGNDMKLSSWITAIQTEMYLDTKFDQIGQLVHQAWEGLRDQIQHASDQQSDIIENLADLIVNVSVAVSNTNVQALCSLAEGKSKESKDRRDLAREKLVEADLEFEAVLKRTRAESEMSERILEMVKEKLDRFADLTFDFYRERQEFQLAEIARNRARAITDVIVGTVKIVKDVALLVLGSGAASGGSASGGSFSPNMLAKKELLSKSFGGKRRIASSVEGYATKGDIVDAYRSQLPSTLSENEFENIKTRITEGDPSILDDPKLADMRNTLSFLIGGLDQLADTGIPLADGAAQVLGGVLDLVDVSRRKKNVVNSFHEGVQEADALFDVIADYLDELSEATAFMAMELFDLITATDTPRSMSIAESTSKTLWQSTVSEIANFLESSLLKADFENMVQQASQVQRRKLDLLEEGKSLEAKLAFRAAMGHDDEIASAPLRRALADKNNYGEKAKQLASKGLLIMESIKSDLDQVALIGEAFHTSMVDLVRTARARRITRATLLAEDTTFGDWQVVKAEICSTNVEGALSRLSDKFRKQVNSLVSFEPELMALSRPSVIQYLEKNFLKKGTNSSVDDGHLQRVCKHVLFRTLLVLDECRLDLSQYSDLSKPPEQVFLSYLDKLEDSSKRALAMPSKPRWVRTRLATAVDVIGQLASSSMTIAADVSENCGANAEVTAMMIVFERAAQNEYGYEPVLWNKPGQTASASVERDSLFFKYDKQGQRYAFTITGALTSQASVLVASSPCEEKDFVLPGGTVVCFPSMHHATIHLPFNGHYKVTLGKSMLSLLATIDPKNTWVTLYAQINVPVDDESRNCLVPYVHTKSPTWSPTKKPSKRPTLQPTPQPTWKPTWKPTSKPTSKPTPALAIRQTESPTLPTRSPTQETKKPSPAPTRKPTAQPEVIKNSRRRKGKPQRRRKR